ncbi:MAG: Calx-beta domain-containing protein [Tepidisphaeraceae bacterium]
MRQSRRRLVRAVRSIIEAVERRQMMDATYYNLSGGSYQQNWESSDLVGGTTWTSTYANAIGYAATTTAVADPQLNTNPSNTSSAVFVATVSPGPVGSGVSAGGLHRLTFASSVGTGAGTGTKSIGFQGSGTAHSPHVIFFINSSGVNNVAVDFDLIDVDNEGSTTAGAAQSFAVQYRIGDSGTWANVPAGYVANAANFTTNTVGQTTHVTAVLPSDAGNKADLQVRVVGTNSAGNDQMVALDNVVISSTTSSQVGIVPSSYTILENGGSAVLTVTRTGDASSAASVNWTAVNGTAIAGTDYGTLGNATPPSGTLTWAAGDSAAKTITIPILDDLISESAEAFTVNLSSPVNAVTAAATLTGTVSITDNDLAAPTGQVFLNEVAVNLNDTDGPYEYVEVKSTTASKSLDGVYFVSIEGDSTSNPGNVSYVRSLSGSTTGTSTLLVLKSAATSYTIGAGVTVITDTLLDAAAGALQNGANSFALVFSPTPITTGTDLDPTNSGALTLPAGASMLDSVGTLDATGGGIAYGPTSPVNITDGYTRIKGNTTINSITAWYGGKFVDPDPTTGGAANSAFLGYDPRRQFGSYVNGAVMTPGAENYDAVAAAASPGQLVLVSPLPVVTGVDPSQIDEGSSITYTVMRFGGTAGTVTALVSNTGGTATAGSDYTAVNSTVSFAAGENTKDVTLNTIDDTAAEGAETVVLTLSNATGGATIASPGNTANITIKPNDATQVSGLVLNEIKIDPPGTDTANEYVEIKGPANTSLVGYWLLGLEGDVPTGTSTITLGQINYAQSLSDFATGANGLLLVRGTAGTPPTVDAGTAIAAVTSLDSAALQNGSQTFVLVYMPDLTQTFTTTVGSFNDFDIDNNGVLDDRTANGIIVQDGVGYVDSDAGDAAYGAVVTQTGYVPDALTRLPADQTPLSAAAWAGGELQTNGAATPVPETLAYDTASGKVFNMGSVTSPALTPGGENFPVPTDTTPPTVTASAMNYLTTHSITVTFSEDVSASLSAADFTLVNNTTPSYVVSSANMNVSYNSGTNTATITFTGLSGASSTILANGNYTFTVLGAGVTDAAGNKLGGGAGVNSTLTFKWANGDANHDGSVNFSDLLALAANYNGTTGMTYATGDFNYDGTVNFSDLLTLAANYNVTIAGTVEGASLASTAVAASPKKDNVVSSVFASDDSVIA